MKKIVQSLSLLLFLGNFYTVTGQNTPIILPDEYKSHHAIYDYSEKKLSNTASIPDYASKPNPLKITGTVFLSDGKTPAPDVILYINQADENGNYELIKNHGERYVYHRAWVKTNADGHYTFYTFIPGKIKRSNDFKKIHMVVKEPNQPVRNGYDLIFDNDPLLTKSCRKKLAKRGIDNILKPAKEDSIFVATKNIVLNTQRIEYAKN